MRYTILLPVILLGLAMTACQKEDVIECEVFADGAWQYMEISVAPEFLSGGEEGLAMAVLQEIRYPAEARENSIEGRVRLEYVITEFGAVENVTIVEDIGGGCGEEARRAFGVATEGVTFSPAEIDGSAVRVRKEIPIQFKLE